MLVTIIGHRATGKTTVARQTAALLDWLWLDSDDEIELRTGRTITDLFATYGERGFREWEEQIIGEMTGRQDVVLSVGGGAVMSEQSRARIRGAGLVVWLRARPETILARMQADHDNHARRPALTTLAADEEIRVKLDERNPLYAELADLTIDTDDLTTSRIADEIVSFVRPRLTHWKRES